MEFLEIASLANKLLLYCFPSTLTRPRNLNLTHEIILDLLWTEPRQHTAILQI